MSIEELAAIAEQLRTQDNAITSHPIFLVQERVLDFGYDADYCEDTVFRHSEGEYVFKAEQPERWARLYAGEYGEDDGEACDWHRAGYQHRWEFVQPFFTRAAADHYCKTQLHRHRGKLRVYVESAHRNPEWQLLRKVIGEL